MPAILYDRFVAQIADLEAVAALVNTANCGIAQRQWRTPESWGGDPLAPADIIPAFVRTELNEAYTLNFTNGDRAADAMAIKLQADYLGSQERAFRARHVGAIRATMHAANRRSGHASATGIFGRIADHVQDVIVSRNTGD